MTIYAIFICAQLTGTCKVWNANITSQMTTYDSLSSCRTAIVTMFGTTLSSDTPDIQGRYPINGTEDPNTGAPDMWYQCLSRHVDTWKQPQN